MITLEIMSMYQIGICGGSDVNKAKRIIDNMEKENAGAICSKIFTVLLGDH